MSTNNITSANSVLLIGVAGLFTVPQQLQGFSSDDAYSMDAVTNKEVQLGVDGIMSAGWIPQIKTMSVTLQGDSDSNTFFEAWYAAEEAAQDAFRAFGTIVQPAVNKMYTLTNGVLTNFAPISDAKKVLQPRKFQIQWNVVLGVPT
jgi:hypothetical protein